MIPCFRYTGLTACAQLFRPSAKVPPARITTRPQASSVQWAPIAAASAPAVKLPIGAKPRKHMTYMLMIRARLSSSATVCRMVLMEAAVTTSPAPKIARKVSDNHKVPDKENPVKATPAVTVATAITRPRPRTELRAARANVPKMAPSPTAPMRKPKVLESPLKVSAAKIGISEDQGAVKKPITMRSSKRRLLPVKPKAYLIPDASWRH